MRLAKYNECIFCGSSKLKLILNQNFTHNFYTIAIKNDFKLSDKFFKKMKIFECEKCYIIQNNPWFSKEISFKIFNQVYGQHNRNWSNAINFFQNGIKPNHGKLFNILNKNLKIKNYCEFNVPFMGLMIDFFSKEYEKNINFYKKSFNYSLKYLSSRQVAGVNKASIKKKQKEVQKYLNKLDKIKIKYKLKKSSYINKSIIIDNTYLSWLYNDNYKSVNSRSLASKILDIKFEDFNLIKKTKIYDLFGIFHTLDHTHQPKKILDFALNNSKYVAIYFHSDENLEKQHLFSFTDKFESYLKKRKIFCKNITFEIEKKTKSKEIYLLCSKFYKINLKL
ncbi:hypothetical protein [Candidatus Pelagibacter sp. HIMB1709]|uniref:hypothetical protein n=1 Tax=Candidatus Pelagibacter sp. HIMB1709 TaxID=3413367 RepID=UPI003F87111D